MNRTPIGRYDCRPDRWSHVRIHVVPVQYYNAPSLRTWAWFSRSYLTDLVAMGRETSSLRSQPDNVLASPLCHSSHQSTPSGVGRFPSRNVATVENSRCASRKLERAKDSIRKARSPRAEAAAISRWRRVNVQTWCLRHPHVIHAHHDVLARPRRLRIATNRVAIRAPEACEPRHFPRSSPASVIVVESALPLSFPAA